MPQTHHILTSKVLISNPRSKASDQSLLMNRNNIKVLAQFVPKDIKYRTAGLGIFHQHIYLHFGGRESQKFSVAVAYHVASYCNTNSCATWSQALTLHLKRSWKNHAGTTHSTLQSKEQVLLSCNSLRSAHLGQGRIKSKKKHPGMSTELRKGKIPCVRQHPRPTCQPNNRR